MYFFRQSEVSKFFRKKTIKKVNIHANDIKILLKNKSGNMVMSNIKISQKMKKSRYKHLKEALSYKLIQTQTIFKESMRNLVGLIISSFEWIQSLFYQGKYKEFLHGAEEIYLLRM